MHKAFGSFARSARAMKPQMTTQSRPILKAIDNDQEDHESNQGSHKNERFSKSDYFKKSLLLGVVMFVGQKIDDTMAHMFFWGSGLQV